MSESLSYTPKISEGLRKFFIILLGDEIGGQMTAFQRRNVGQLKQIFSALYRMPFVVHHGLAGQLSAYRRKDKLISDICKILYDDYPSCQVIRIYAERDILSYIAGHEEARERQQRVQQQIAAAVTATSVAASAPVASLPPCSNNQASDYHAMMLNAYAQQFHNQPNSATANAVPPPSSRSLLHTKSPPKQVQFQPRSAASSARPVPAAFSPKAPSDKKKSPARNAVPPIVTVPSVRPIPVAFTAKLSSAKRKLSVENALPPKANRVKVKKEPKSDDESSFSAPMQQSVASHHDSTPHNAREHALTVELMAMGFTDRTEILWSVRKLARSYSLSEVTCENVMLDIITNREEVDEARKMDEARRLSERTRKEESKRLRGIIAQSQADERKKASWSEWSSRADMYKSSWLLANVGVREALDQRVQSNLHLKETLMEVLDLEKKSRKWYGQTLPRAYFRGTLAQRFSSRIERDSSVEQVLTMMKNEISSLKEAMFTLSVQQGGVPKLFVDAHDSPTAVSGDDAEEVDEEIVVVRVDGGLMGPEKRLSTPKTLRRQQIVQRTPEIIEIE